MFLQGKEHLHEDLSITTENTGVVRIRIRFIAKEVFTYREFALVWMWSILK